MLVQDLSFQIFTGLSAAHHDSTLMQFAANFDSSSIDSMQFPIVPSTYSLLPLAASRMSAAKTQADASTCLPPAAVLTI